jgi:dipeptidase E
VPTHAFLGSASLAAVPSWLAQLPHRPSRAVLVPTAGNRLAATPWVETTITQLEDCGLTVMMLDLETASPAGTAAAVAAADLVWVTGGHPLFLLEHAVATGFLDTVRTRVCDGSLYYGGISAGAALATADLAGYRGPDDPGVVDDTTGLGLISCYPLVHANRGRQQRYAELIASHPDREFVTLTDDQALIVTGSSWHLIT